MESAEEEKPDDPNIHAAQESEDPWWQEALGNVLAILYGMTWIIIICYDGYYGFSDSFGQGVKVIAYDLVLFFLVFIPLALVYSVLRGFFSKRN